MREPQDGDDFIAEKRRLLQDNPECATTSYNLGVELLEQGRLDEAADAFRDATENSGRMFEAWVNLGYIYFTKGDLEGVSGNTNAMKILKVTSEP